MGQTTPHNPPLPAPTARPAWSFTKMATLCVGLLFGAVICARAGLDGVLVDAARGLTLGGDVKRELEVLQQFGAPASIAIAFLLMLALDRNRARRILDVIFAAVATSLTALALKMLIGRPRPVLGDPDSIHGPLTAVNVKPGETAAVIYAWQLGADGVERLWSLPSSHTGAAVALATVLAVLYPRLVWFAVAMAALVGSCRVLFGAHWPSDVLVGAALAHAIAYPVARFYVGTRFIDAVWRRFVDPEATEQWRVQRDLDRAAAPVPSAQ